jgi:nucleotide-binding universal stress UspA family protein
MGMDVHQATISVAVMDAHGKLLMECLLETKASTIVDFIQGLHGTLSLTFEEGTSAAWLHDLLKPQVSRLVVCDPRKAALLKEGNKSDRIDARKRAELLRTNQLQAVYHEEHGIRALKELGRSYLTITQEERAADLIVMGVKKSSESVMPGHSPWPVASQVVAEASCPVPTVRG